MLDCCCCLDAVALDLAIAITLAISLAVAVSLTVAIALALAVAAERCRSLGTPSPFFSGHVGDMSATCWPDKHTSVVMTLIFDMPTSEILPT